MKVLRRGNKVSILTDSPSETVRLGTSLRAVLGDTAVVAVKGGYLVPLEATASLARLLPPDANEWEQVLAEKGVMAIATMHNQTRARREVADALETPYQALKDYEGLSQLDNHQVEAVAAMTAESLQGMALFDEQGTGKTACALAAFDILRQRGSITNLLVVAPKSVLSVWKSEAEQWFGGRYSLAVFEGKQAKTSQFLQNDNDVLLVSYEAATRGSTVLRGMASSKGRRFMLVVDESYYVKNPAAQRSRAVAQLRPFCERAYVLCGTPAPNSPRDVVHQIDITDSGVTFGGMSLPDDDASAAVVIQEALGGSAIYLRRLKEEVLPSLPPKSTVKVMVDLQPVQAGLYMDALNNLVIDVRGVDDTHFRKHLGEFLARKWALLQICSNPGAVDPLYEEVPAKFLALDQLVKSAVEDQGTKIVIWSFFRYSLEAIFKRYGMYGVARIDGSVDSLEERATAIRRFQEDPSTRVFVGSPAAAGAGITLTAAHQAAYESFSNQPAHYLQSVDRIHRRGQHNTVTSYALICRGTIEQREFDKLRAKERRGHALFGKVPSEAITREVFLKDLLGE